MFSASQSERHRLLVGFDSADAVTALAPDFHRLGQLRREIQVDTVAAFALFALGEDPGGDITKPYPDIYKTKPHKKPKIH